MKTLRKGARILQVAKGFVFFFSFVGVFKRLPNEKKACSFSKKTWDPLIEYSSASADY